MPDAIINAATRSHARALLVLTAVGLLSFLPGFLQIPPVDRDEARFAQASKQMIETGDYVNIRFQDEPRFKKPVGIYWLQSFVVRAARATGVRHALTTIWLYRLPSLAGAIGAVWLTYWAALALVSRRAAVLAALMMAASVLLGVEARLATTDATLLLTTVAAMGGLARLYVSAHGRPLSRAQGWGAAAVIWTALAAGVLLKGPVIVLVAALCVAALVIRDRSIRWLAGLRPLVGLVWFAALVLPWFLTVSAQSGPALIADSTRDILPKLFRGMEGHGAPPGYYFVLFWVTFWPGSMLAGLAGRAVWTSRREPATSFLLAWLVSTWFVFELAATKMPHYVLPLYPAAAILIAHVVDTGRLSRGPRFVHRLMSRGAEHALLWVIAVSILLSAVVLGVIAPRAKALFPSAAMAEVMSSTGCARPQAVTAWTYQEPSVIFLTGTATRATDAAGAVIFLGGGPCRFAFVDAADADSFRHRAEAAHLRFLQATSVEGINISKGTAVTLLTFWSGGP